LLSQTEIHGMFCEGAHVECKSKHSYNVGSNIMGILQHKYYSVFWCFECHSLTLTHMDDICSFRGTLRVTSTDNAHTTLPRTDDSSFWGRARERMSIKIIRDNGATIKYWPHRVTYYIFKCFYMALVCNVNVYDKLKFSTRSTFVAVSTTFLLWWSHFYAFWWIL